MAVITKALHQARETWRPVAVNMPVDVQEREWAPWTHEESDPPTTTATSVDREQVAKAARSLLSARRPVIIAGRGAMRAGCESQILDLAEAIGALIGTTLPAKGMFAGQVVCIGVVGFRLVSTLQPS